MRTPLGRKRRLTSRAMFGSLVLTVALVVSGCAGMPIDVSQLPFELPFLQATPTFTPTPVPTPTPTPEPTPTLEPGEEREPPTPTPIPTPEVNIPDGFTPVVDEDLGYSLAVPGGWSVLDLRSQQFQNLAGTFGMGDQLAPLNEFLESPEGDSLGVIYVTDLMSAMFGGLPTGLNVFVIESPGVTPDSLLEWLQAQIDANSQMLGDANIESLETATINNIPGVRGSATANLSSVGMNVNIFGKVVAQIANDKIYIMTLVTQESQRGDREPTFDQIIGTFRPE